MNPRLNRLCVAALVTAGFLTLIPRASADVTSSLTLTYNGGGNGQNGGGPFNWSQNPPGNNPAFVNSFVTYCIDTQDTVRSGTFTTHTDLTKAPTIANALTTNPNVVSQINTLYDHFYSSSFQSQTDEAAFQAALWSLVYGAPTTNSIAQNLLDGKGYNGAAYNGTEHDLANASLVALVDSSGLAPGKWGRDQDQIVVVPNQPPVKGVPAPPALMLAGVGVLGLIGRARWTRRSPTAV